MCGLAFGTVTQAGHSTLPRQRALINPCAQKESEDMNGGERCSKEDAITPQLRLFLSPPFMNGVIRRHNFLLPLPIFQLAIVTICPLSELAENQKIEGNRAKFAET